MRRKVIAIAPKPEPKTVAQAYAESLPQRPELRLPHEDGEQLVAYVTQSGSMAFDSFYPQRLTPKGAIKLAYWILDTFEKVTPPAEGDEHVEAR